jgi:hypothetical protein
MMFVTAESAVDYPRLLADSSARLPGDRPHGARRGEAPDAAVQVQTKLPGDEWKVVQCLVVG